jgi:hypothetical protein
VSTTLVATNQNAVLVVVVIAVALIFALIGGIIGARKGYALVGALLGFVFGPIGVVVMLVIPARGQDWPDAATEEPTSG